MAKEEKKANAVLVALIFVAILIFGGAFYAGYFYQDMILEILGPRVRTTPEEEFAESADRDEIQTLDKDLPSSFPSDFPIYNNAELSDSWTASGNNTEGVSAIWLTDDSIADVTSFYQDRLKTESWEIGTQKEGASSTTISFEKGDTSGFIGITKGEEEKTIVSVTMGVTNR